MAYITFVIVSVTLADGASSAQWNAFVNLGRQVAKDGGFLLPTLLAFEAILVGIPLAQSRYAVTRADEPSRHAAVGTFATAAIGVATGIVATVGAIGDAETASRLWSIVILVGLLVVVAFWTAGLVFATPAEQLRFANEDLKRTVASLELRIRANPKVAVPSSREHPLRHVLRVNGGLLAGVWLLVVVWSLINRYELLHDAHQHAASDLLGFFLRPVGLVLFVGVPALYASYCFAVPERVPAIICLAFSVFVWAVCLLSALQDLTAWKVVLLVILAVPIVAALLPAGRQLSRINGVLPRVAAARYEIYRVRRRVRILKLDILSLEKAIAKSEESNT